MASPTRAQRIVDRLVASHPDWLQRRGDAGLHLALADVEQHLEFLDTAVQDEDRGLFEAYTDWCRRLMDSRQTPQSALVGTFAAMCEDVDPAQRALLEAAIARLQGPPPEPPRAAPLPSEIAELADHLVAGDRAAVTRILRAADPIKVADSLICPAMEEIGRRWFVHEVSVAREHLATATCRSAMATLNIEMPPANVVGTVVLASVEGNRHDLGLTLLADRLEAVGWQTELLGPDVPTGDLVDLAKEDGPDMVCLSLALPSHLLPARRAVAALRRAGVPRVVVGGRLVRDFPETGRLTGAQEWPRDVGEALRRLA